MILRAIVLSLVLLFGIGVVIPLGSQFTVADGLAVKNRKKKYKNYKKHSKRWWRAYHRRQRRMMAINARRRMQRLRRIRLEKANWAVPRTPMQRAPETEPAVQNDKFFQLVEGKIVRVYNGEIVSVEDKDGKVYLVRMLGIDAPAINQEFGSESQKHLSSLILGRGAIVILRKKDSAGRYLGTIYYGGEDINYKQLAEGMAFYFQQNDYGPVPGDEDLYKSAERKAKTEGKGIWKRQRPNSALSSKK